MQNVETIYRETIRPLPIGDQKRLADMILDNVDSHVSAEKLPVLDILEAHPVKTSLQGFKRGRRVAQSGA